MQEFDKFAGKYAEVLNDPLRNVFADDPAHFHQRKLDLLRRILRDRRLSPDKMTWVDVGCGRGDLLKLGRPWFHHATGCDVSAEMLAQSDAADLLHQTNPQSLPFPDATADLVSAVCIFHHVEDADRVPLLGEIRRLLKPGGLLALIEHNPFNPVTRWIVKRSPVDENAHLLSPATVRQLLRDAGLGFEQIQFFLYLPEKLYLCFGKAEYLVRKVPLGGQYLILARNGE